MSKKILTYVVLQIFFGTPHRACPQHSWEFTLSRLLCHLYPGTLGPWLPATVRRLADFHEEVSREFGFINQKKPVTIVSYYQVEAVAEDYEVVGCISSKTSYGLRLS